MAYLADSGLLFLEKCSSADLAPLYDLLSQPRMSSLSSSAVVKEHFPDHHKYWQLIAEELQKLGGHTIANINRGTGVRYKEIICDVCEKIDIKYSPKADVATTESLFMLTLTKKIVCKMTDEELTILCDDLGWHSIQYDETSFKIIQRHFYKSYKFIKLIQQLIIADFIKDACKGNILGLFSPNISIGLSLLDLIALLGPSYRVVSLAILLVADLRSKYIEYDLDIRPRLMPKRGAILRCDLSVGFEHSGVCINEHEVVEIYNNKGTSEVRKVDWFEFVYGDLSADWKGRSGATVYMAVDKRTGGFVADEVWARNAERYIGHTKPYRLVSDNCHTFSYACVASSGFKDHRIWRFSDLTKQIEIIGNHASTIEWKACDINPGIELNACNDTKVNIEKTMNEVNPHDLNSGDSMTQSFDTSVVFGEQIQKIIKSLEQHMLKALTGNHFEKSRQLKDNILKHAYETHRIFSLANHELSLGLDNKIDAFKETQREIKNDVYTVAVFGQFSTGKSTFLNVLSGLQTLPMADERCTATFTRLKFCHEDVPYAEVTYKSPLALALEYKDACDGINEIDTASFPIEKIEDNRDELLKIVNATSLMDYDQDERELFKNNKQTLRLILEPDQLPALGKSERMAMDEIQRKLADDKFSYFIDEVTFYIKHPLFADVEVVDTPGFGSSNQLHTRKAQGFIKKSHAVLLLTDAGKPLQGQTEIDFLNQYYEVFKGSDRNVSADNMFLILNKVDQVTANPDKAYGIIQDELNNNFDGSLVIPEDHIFSMSARYHLLVDSGKPVDIADYPHVQEDDLKRFIGAYQHYLTAEKDNGVMLGYKRAVEEPQQELVILINDRKDGHRRTVEDIEDRIARFKAHKQQIQAVFHNHIDAVAGLDQNLRDFVNEKLQIISSESMQEAAIESRLNDFLKRKCSKKPNQINKKDANRFFKADAGEWADTVAKELELKHNELLEEKINLINDNINDSVNNLEHKYELSGLNKSISIKRLSASSFDADFSLGVLLATFDFIALGCFVDSSTYAEKIAELWQENTDVKVRSELFSVISKSTEGLKVQLKQQASNIVNSAEDQLQAQKEQLRKQQGHHKEFLANIAHVDAGLESVENNWLKITEQYQSLYGDLI